MDSSKMKEENFIGTLVGCAIGDSLGMPIEGWDKNRIKKHFGKITELIEPVIVKDSNGNVVTEDEFGKIKYYTKDFKKGQYTDDTILTVAIAKSIVDRKKLDLRDTAEKQLKEYVIRKKEDGIVFGGFGTTTMLGFENLLKGSSPEKSGVIGGPGNAPAMKMSPVCLYMAITGKYDEGIIFAWQVGKITHLDPRSVASGVVQAHAVYSLIKNYSKEEFLNSLVERSYKVEEPTTKEFPLYDKGTLSERLKWVIDNKDAKSDEAHNHLKSTSVVFSSYPFAIFMFQKYWGSPIEGLIETINYGGDCDTTGAIYGALAGAKNGMVFTKAWLNHLENLDLLKTLGKKIYDLKNG